MLAASQSGHCCCVSTRSVLSASVKSAPGTAAVWNAAWTLSAARRATSCQRKRMQHALQLTCVSSEPWAPTFFVPPSFCPAGEVQASARSPMSQPSAASAALPLPPTLSRLSHSPAPLGPSPLPLRAHPPTLPLTEALYNLTRSDPAVLEDPAVLAAFQAAPWLLPCGHAAGLPYASVGSRDLDSLLQAQSHPVDVTIPAALAVPEEWQGSIVAVPGIGTGAGAQERLEFPQAVSLLLFSWHYALMAQNYIYGLVRHAGK